MPFSSKEINIAILQGQPDHPKWLKSQIDDQGIGKYMELSFQTT